MISSRKTSVILLMILLVLLCGCTAEKDNDNVCEIEIGGSTGIVEFEPNNLSAGTITIGNDRYSFKYDYSGGKVEIVYPDDNKYNFTLKDMGVAYPVDYDSNAIESKGYLDVLQIIWGIDDARNSHNGKGSETSSRLLGIFIIALGGWSLFSPKSIWMISRGLWIKDAEPSDFALVFYRGVGAFIVVIGIIYLIAHI